MPKAPRLVVSGCPSPRYPPADSEHHTVLTFIYPRMSCQSKVPMPTACPCPPSRSTYNLRVVIRPDWTPSSRDAPPAAVLPLTVPHSTRDSESRCMMHDARPRSLSLSDDGRECRALCVRPLGGLAPCHAWFRSKHCLGSFDVVPALRGCAPARQDPDAAPTPVLGRASSMVLLHDGPTYSKSVTKTAHCFPSTSQYSLMPPHRDQTRHPHTSPWMDPRTYAGTRNIPRRRRCDGGERVRVHACEGREWGGGGGAAG
ncbi:hypothetical protein JB92DRAFT_353538 [Gautieria morchelliformis]|nr:hypothetical protein JB92DRAFT_353538 [Gautieria morchelliformis]